MISKHTRIPYLLIAGTLIHSSQFVGIGADSNEELSALAAISAAAAVANPVPAQERFNRTHDGQPPKQVVEDFQMSISEATLKVLDQAAEFQKRFPSSDHLGEVSTLLSESLWETIGARDFPIPGNKLSELESCAKDLIEREPKDFRRYVVLYRVACNLPIERQRSVFEKLSRSPSPVEVQSQAKEALLRLDHIGKSLNLAFTSVDGRKIDSSSFNGKVLIVDFWATTCLPCLRDFPELKKLLAKHTNQGLEVVGVCLDSDVESVKRTIGKLAVPWSQFCDRGGASVAYASACGIREIPALWLVDREGIIRYVDGTTDLAQKVESLLNKD